MDVIWKVKKQLNNGLKLSFCKELVFYTIIKLLYVLKLNLLNEGHWCNFELELFYGALSWPKYSLYFWEQKFG